MFDDVLVIIPARKGSKRFPGKNFALFNGVPLWENTVNIALCAGLKNIVMSTDDHDCADQVEEKYPDLILHWRSLKNSSDHVRMEDVVIEVIEQIPPRNVDTLCLLQVTTPLLTSDVLYNAIDVYFKTKLKGLVSVNPAYQPNGAFYIRDLEDFKLNPTFYPEEKLHLYMMYWRESIDVDFEYQLRIATVIDNRL
jgi:CMP-N-acetylneuraminic acid synthetase